MTKTQTSQKTNGLKVKTFVKAGGFGGTNHNRTAKAQTLQKTSGLKVKTLVKAGGFGGTNHNRALNG